MKILFFYTSFRQFIEILFTLKLFNTYKILEKYKDVKIDLIFHNNNKNYPKQQLKIIEKAIQKFNPNPNLNYKKINTQFIHTPKNIGYLWGAQEAIADNYHLFYNYNFVIHTNPDVYITDLNYLIDYLNKKEKEPSIFFVKKFRNKDNNGFSTDFTIFKPKLNLILSNESNKSNIDNIYRSYLNTKQKNPELVLQKAIQDNNITYEVLPKYLTTQKDSVKSVSCLCHIHKLDLLKPILNIVKSKNK